MKRFLPLTLLLAACAAPVEPPPFDAELARVKAEWLTTYDIPAGTCEARPTITFITVDGLAHSCPETLACYRREPNEILIGWHDDWDLGVLAVHEYAHWLSGCTGLYPDYQHDHDDPLIWKHGGIVERAGGEIVL